MAELKIRIATEIGQSLDALNKETRSVKTLSDALIHAKDGTKSFTSAQKAFVQGLERDLQKAFDSSKGSLKGYEAELKILEKYETNLRLGIGKTSKTYQDYSGIIAKVREEIAKIKTANAEAQTAQEQHNEAVRSFALYIQDVERQMENLRALNNQNANVGFMMLTGDEIGVANYALRQYEQTLKETIAATGINSEETQKALGKYREQKAVVEELTISQRELANAEAQTAQETSSFTKLLSVGKNILKFQLLMAPITALVRGFRNTLSDSVKVAAEAEQRFNKLSTVFDGFANTAKRTAQELASAIGVANSTAASALSTVGDLLQAQGMGVSESLETATEWVSKFQDIIAFKDIDMSLEEFAQNFMSGAAGNLRNFRTFGSIVKESAVNAELAKQGLDKLTGSQLELAKMTIRANMALEQQANAMGATQREWDTMLSVNRRLNEEWKALKENLGDTINNALKPVKSWWTNILTEINKATKAQKEFVAGSKDINVYDIYKNQKDAQTFRSTLANAMNSYDTGMRFAGQTLDGTVMASEDQILSATLNTLNATIIQFGASVSDVEKILGTKLPEAMYAELKALEQSRQAEIKRAREIEQRTATLETVRSGYDSFTETLKAIAGVNIETTSFGQSIFDKAVTSDSGAARYQELIKGSILTAVDNALISIGNAAVSEIESWGDVISGQLDDLDNAELLASVAESYRNLFEAAWNEFVGDGEITSEEEYRLNAIKKAYQDAKKALDNYNSSLKAQEDLLKTYESSQQNIKDRAGVQKYKNLGYSDEIASLKYDESQAQAQAIAAFKSAWQVDKQVNELGLAVIQVGDQFLTLSGILSIIWQDYKEQIKAIEDSIEAQKKEAAQSTVQGYLSDFAESDWEREQEQTFSLMGISSDDMSIWIKYEKILKDVREAFSNLAQGEMVEFNGQLYTLEDAEAKVVEARNKELDAMRKQEQELFKLSDSLAQNMFGGKYEETGFMQNLASAISGSLGGQLVEAGIQGAEAGGFWGSMLGVFSTLIQKTEVFQEILDVLDPIVDIMNAFLKPLMPIIESIGSTVSTIFKSILEPLFPAFKLGALALLTISKTVETIAKAIGGTVRNVGTFFHNALAVTIGQLWGMERKEYYDYSDIGDIWASYGDEIKTIMNATLDIAENTKQDDGQLKAYMEMFHKGLINASEYQGLISGLKGINYDRMRTYNGAAWQNTSNGNTIIYQDKYEIVVNGTNLTADEIAEALERRKRIAAYA